MNEPPSTSASAAGSLLASRILVAEDSPESSRFIAWSLRRAGAHVELAANGREALQRFEAHAAQGEDFHLLLTDIEMPELDGFELVKILRARGTRLPILALTARDQAEDRLQVLACGFDDYLSKPCQKDQLVAACRKWLPAAATSTASDLVAAAGPEIVR